MATKKKSTKKITQPAAEVVDQVLDIDAPEISPAEAQALHDGADGTRCHSAREVAERHGRDNVRANELRAKQMRRG